MFNSLNTKHSNSNDDDYNNNDSKNNNYKKDMFTTHTKCSVVRDMEIKTISNQYNMSYYRTADLGSRFTCDNHIRPHIEG